MRNPIICPGCGWTGRLDDLTEKRACPRCQYENSASPYRLLLLDEILTQNDGELWNDVDLGAFVRSLYRLMNLPPAS